MKTNKIVKKIVEAFRKHETVLPIMEFCNIGTDPADLLGFYKRWHIIHTLEGEKRGYDQILSTRSEERCRYILTPEILPAYEDSIKTGFLIPLSDGRWQDLPAALNAIKNEYIDFLVKAGNGILEVSTLNKWMQNMKDFEIGFTPDETSEDQMNPKIQHQINHTASIETWIEAKTLNWFLNKQGEIFTYVGQCEWCHKFFFQKRPDQVYCSSRCSSKNRGLTYRNKPGARKAKRDFVAKKRLDGLYQ